MSYTTDLLTGFAQKLADAGLGVYHTDPTAPYLSTDTAIVFKNMPATPDRCIVLNLYGTGAPEDPQNAVSQLGLQVRARGLPNPVTDVNDIMGSIFLLLHGMTHQQFGSVHVNQCFRNSSVPMGQDTNKREEHADNYYLDCDMPPGANRT
jgi:hypothetical protein